MEGLKTWAYDELGRPEPVATAQPPVEDEAAIPPGMELLTVEELLQRDDLPQMMREWLEMYAQQGGDWAKANNPPSWVADESCWEKAKRAADHAGASDRWAFASWWYTDHAGCAMK